GMLCSEIAIAEIRPEFISTIVEEIATDPSGRLCKIMAQETKSADFLSGLPPDSNFIAANLKNATIRTPIINQDKIDAKGNPADAAAGINSKALTRIIAAAASIKQMATSDSESFFLSGTTPQPTKVVNAARADRKKPICILLRLLNKRKPL
ncbi:MAG: hypothetical protein RIS57_1032, partial [Actinomycetota bacterium]